MSSIKRLITPKMIVNRGLGLVLTKVSLIKEQLFSPKYLLYTNVAISISLSATGDVLEQHYELLKGSLAKWDPKRTRNMAISGMSVGVLCHYWYNFLDARMPGRAIRTVLKKVIVDQLVCSPLCIATFFLTLAVMENSSFAELKKEVMHKAHILYMAEWVIWPPAQLINFLFLPTKYRVFYDNTISLGYDVYVSQVKHHDKAPAD